MLEKNLLEPLVAPSHDASVQACCSTPHSIKLSSIEEEENYRNGINCNQLRTELACVTAEAGETSLSEAIQQLDSPAQQPTQNFAKAISKKPRKALRRPLVQRKLTSDNRKLTEYFPVRRSVRKCKTVVLEEKQRDLEFKIRCGLEDGLEVRQFSHKGRGVVTTKDFTKGEYVVEYAGELIDLMTAKKRELMYAAMQNAGCYMYYFQYRNQQYCVDATAESSRLGRLVNHSRNGNLTTRIVTISSIPHLVLIAKEDIPTGVELSYDYGDRSRESIRNHPWLAL